MTEKPAPGCKVILKEVPPDLLDGLPMEDQAAISEAARTPLLLNEYDEHGRAELQFTAKDGVIHFIWVDPKLITAVE
jgi:hypothetical protein